MTAFEKWRAWARGLKREAMVLYVALRDARTPWYAKAAAACVVAYALSPIDLIPDPIPVLGYLDDLIIVPVGIWLVRRLIPATVLVESRIQIEAGNSPATQIGKVGATIIVLLWVVTIVALFWIGRRLWFD
jgi:uncharacterized membrane protein YkvA (DUF1232 family)